MKYLLLTVAFGLSFFALSFSAEAKGPGQLELTPEVIKQRGLSWDVSVKEDYRGVLTFEILVKLPPEDKKEEILARLGMFDENGNWLMMSRLHTGNRTGGHVYLSFELHKRMLSQFEVLYSAPSTVREGQYEGYVLRPEKFYKAGQ